mgnify:CR=1 FL=1
MARYVWIGIMAKAPKKVTSRLSKDVREVIREMSQNPTGKSGKGANRTTPKLTQAEVEAAKQRAQKVQPLFIKQDPKKLNAEQINKTIKAIAKERGITIAKAKEVLWKELSKSPPVSRVGQPTVLSKAIPTRQELESSGYRAVKYQGKTIYLSPAQIKQIAKDAGIKVDFPKGSEVSLFKESPKGSYQKITGISPEARAAIDRKAAQEELRLRLEAMRDWEAQNKAAAVDPRVRKPAEALGKASPTSTKAELYAERLYQKAYKELTPNERKSIKIIIQEEARRASQVNSSVVGRRNIPRIGGIPGVGFGQGLDQIK